MNNLLKTISESHLRASLPEADLKLLLSSVSDVRSHDAKAADSFYASLESVLLELRTVTPDSRDAEAFLKPVSRVDYPDYYEVIKHPMDLATMLKNVKARKYNTKEEFAADLNLIWKNCFKYNSGPDHILRGCATRLKRKAEHLLAHVSDRPDQITINGLPTPSAPPSSASSRASPYKPPKVNGVINGMKLSRVYMPTPDPVTPQAAVTPNTPGPSYTKSPRSVSGRPLSSKASSPAIPAPVAFAEQPALVRTPASMNLFIQLDQELQRTLEGTLDETDLLPMMAFESQGKGKEPLVQRLQVIADDTMEVDDEEQTGDGRNTQVEDSPDRHLKRKRSLGAHDHRKRLRLMESLAQSGSTGPVRDDLQEDLLDLWWDAARSNSLFMGGLPSLPQFHSIKERKKRGGKGPRLRPAGTNITKRKRSSGGCGPAKALLNLMNDNIATLNRIRRTHAKFVALNANADSTNPATIPAPDPLSEHEVQDELVIQEKGWKVQGEVDQPAADACLSWMGGKVLQHAGFQGKTSPPISRIGRTIRFLSDKYATAMSAEEIILHTLFEGGVSEIQDLERYIKDDVVRYGGRLGDLEKKLVGAYREVTSVEVLNDEGIFEEGDDADHFASGGLADILGGGEDFLGLRELGIEAEFGLKSLSIPKRLWNGKSGVEDRTAPDRAHAGEPPPPFPHPPAFIPLDHSKVDAQIGLLKGFYQERFTALSASTRPSLDVPATTIFAARQSTPDKSSSMHPSSLQTSSHHILPDDPPPTTRSKLGPLGQIIVSNPSSSANKKKGKTKEVHPEHKSNFDKNVEAATKKKDPKKKKSKDDPADDGVDDNLVNAGVNGIALKKKLKPSGSKKTVNGAKPPDVPPAIIASA
ncbi:hypothetical protein BU17DRAFT_94325 [Hysterangium stoloniferum]|nr:hypothetical protein BU17DRAFT_94325 [Hysterangium stoloniferum]